MSMDRQPELDLSEHLANLWHARWRMAGVFTAALMAGGLYLFLAPPVYQVDALVQAEARTSGMPVLGELSQLFESTTELATEIEIVRSRAVVGAVVDELGLALEARPQYLPLLGAALARRHDGPELAAPPPGLGGYAWGGEAIAVRGLELPAFLLERPLTLVAGQEGRYRLLDGDGRELAAGRVGERAQGQAEDPAHAGVHGPVALRVERLRARPGSAFELVGHSRLETVVALQRRLRVNEVGRDTGILRIALEGEDPDQAHAVLTALTRHYVRQNVDRRSAEAEQMLQFTRAQLPALRASLDGAEEALNRYRADKGSVDVSLEIHGLLDQVVEVERAISSLELERTELRQHYTPEHPRQQSLADKLGQLHLKRDLLNRELKALPETEWDTVRLMRDVKVASELYVLLLNRAQELAVARAGTIGNVWVLDPPERPEKPVGPDPLVVLVQAALAGLLAGLAAVFGPQLWRRTLRDPAQVERALGVPVYAVVAHSRAQRRLGQGEEDGGLLALSHPDELAVEGLRSLRTSLQFALADAQHQVVCISGPTAGVGKSFVSANLAALVASAGRRVLLVDGDLRLGHQQDHFGTARSPGLSEVLAGSVAWEQAVVSGRHPQLDFLPAGTVPPNPSELLLSERLGRFLGQAREAYDVVLVDTPPVLPVTDPCLLARHAGALFLVLRSGGHTLHEVELALKRFAQNGSRVDGVVFNGVERGSSGYGYGYGYGYGAYAGRYAPAPAGGPARWLGGLMRRRRAAGGRTDG